MKNTNELKKLASNLSILVVENDPSTQKELMEYFKKLFKNIYEASDGMAGLELYKKETPSVILTNLELPKMTGQQMITNIKKIDQFAPIIVISSKTDSETLLESIHLGITDFVPQPLEYKLLDNALIAAIQLSQIKHTQESKELLEESPFEALEALKKATVPFNLSVRIKVFLLFIKEPLWIRTMIV